MDELRPYYTRIIGVTRTIAPGRFGYKPTLAGVDAFALPDHETAPGRWRSHHKLKAGYRGIAEGLSSEDAAMEVGVSQPVGSRWFRVSGGMAPSRLSRLSKPPSARYLTFAEREDIALLRAQGAGVREVARRLGRAASTISRELRRNAATRGGNLDYRQ